jgi:hypothetical protein
MLSLTPASSPVSYWCDRSPWSNKYDPPSALDEQLLLFTIPSLDNPVVPPAAAGPSTLPAQVPATPAPLALEQQHITAVEEIVPTLQKIVATSLSIICQCLWTIPFNNMFTQFDTPTHLITSHFTNLTILPSAINPETFVSCIATTLSIPVIDDYQHPHHYEKAYQNYQATKKLSQGMFCPQSHAGGAQSTRLIGGLFGSILV